MVKHHIWPRQQIITVSYSTTMPNTTVQPERKPAFARPSGTTTSATAPAAKRNTITDSSTALIDACAHPWSLHDSDPTSSLKIYDKIYKLFKLKA